MKLKVAFQMDPLPSLNYAADTTVALIFEAARRGYELYFYEPHQLTWSNHQVRAPLFPLSIDTAMMPPLILSAPEQRALSDMDVIWIRQNPPFDLGYFTNTYLLESLPPTTLVLNAPQGVRNAPEKLLITKFPHLMPPTLITEDPREIALFQEQHGDIVLKPLYEFGGAGVFYMKPGDVNFAVAIEMMHKSYPNQPWMVQKFLPEVRQGDKRLLLLDGEFIGGFCRVPLEESIRSNLVRGGQGKPYQPTEKDEKICEELAPMLKEMGLFFIGLDIIGDYLTEINVTSPTGIHMLNQLNKMHVERLVWDKVLEKIL